MLNFKYCCVAIKIVMKANWEANTIVNVLALQCTLMLSGKRTIFRTTTKKQTKTTTTQTMSMYSKKNIHASNIMYMVIVHMYGIS